MTVLDIKLLEICAKRGIIILLKEDRNVE